MTRPVKPQKIQDGLEAGSSGAIPQQEKRAATSNQPTMPGSDEDAGTETSKKPLSFWLAFVALNITVFIVSLDSTALAVAVPRITQDLQGTTLEAFWTNLSFILAIVINQPIYITISDVLGRKIPLYAAFLLFFVGSIVFGVAHNMPVLIVGRILQGLAVFRIPYPNKRKGFVSFITTTIDIVVLAFFFLHLRSIDSSFHSEHRRLDWIGMLLFTVSSTTFALPLSWADALYPWSSWRTTLLFIIGAIILVTMLTIQMTARVQHMDDMGVAGSILISFCLFSALVGLAICSTVFNNVFEQRIASTATLPLSVEKLKDTCEAISFIPTLRLTDLQPRILKQVIEAYRVSMMTLTGTGAVGFFMSFFTRKLTLEREDLERQQFEKFS